MKYVPTYEDIEHLLPNKAPQEKSLSYSPSYEDIAQLINAPQQVPQESYGQSLLAAPGRIAEDVGSAVYSGLQALPSYYEKAKTEIPGIFSTAYQHPGHLAKQVMAGSLEAINSIMQIPGGLSKYGSERLNLTPQGITDFLQKNIPNKSEQINELLGKPEYPGEELARGIGRNALPLYGVGKVGQAVTPFLKGKRSIQNAILKQHDYLENRASSAFKNVSNEVNKRGINTVPLTLAQENSILNLNEYFPRTKSAQNLLFDAAMGDYNSLRKLQSDLFKKAKSNLSSDLEMDRLRGAEILERRSDVNDLISNHLLNTGNVDLYKTLEKGRNDYRTLMQEYYNENIPNALKKMTTKEIRKIPSNLIDVLSEQSKPMQRYKDIHIGLENAIKKMRFRNKTLKLGGLLGTAGIGGVGGYELNNYLKK